MKFSHKRFNNVQKRFDFGLSFFLRLHQSLPIILLNLRLIKNILKCRWVNVSFSVKKLSYITFSFQPVGA